MTEQAGTEPLRIMGVRAQSDDLVTFHGHAVPSWFVVTLFRESVPYSVDVRVHVDPDEGPVPVGVHVISRSDPTKTYKDAVALLRGAPMASLLHQALSLASNSAVWNQGLVELGKPDGRGLTQTEATRLGAKVAENEVKPSDFPVPTRRRSITPGLLREVAEVYRRAYAEGNAPTQAVALHFVITKPTAARWVREARRAGALGPSVGTTGGEASVDQ